MSENEPKKYKVIVDEESLRDFEEWAQKTPGIDRKRPGTGQAPIRGYRRQSDGSKHSPDRKFGVS